MEVELLHSLPYFWIGSWSIIVLMLGVVVLIQEINLRLGEGMTIGFHVVKLLCMNSGNPILKHSNGCIQTEMIFKDLQHLI